MSLIKLTMFLFFLDHSDPFVVASLLTSTLRFGNHARLREGAVLHRCSAAKNMCFLDFLGEGTTTLETLEILNTKPLGKVDFCL